MFCVLLVFFSLAPSESVSIPMLGEHDADFSVFLVIFRGALRIDFDSDVGSGRCELCGVDAQRIELDPKGRESTMRAVMDGVSVWFDAQRIELDPRDWGRTMRAVGGVFRSQRICLDSWSWNEDDAGCRGFLFGGDYDDWPTAKGDDWFGVRTGDAKIAVLCYYKYCFQCGDVCQHSWLVWGMVDR